MAQQALATAPAPTGGEIIESVIVKGDLAKLSPEERTRYYVEVCKSVGLNPLTKPFEYITLNGKLTLYALRGCTDQLRAIYGVSVEELIETEREGVLIVTAKVRNRDGRTDMAKGAVTIVGLKGDNLANAIMKAETKAKRRATLSVCGLGMLDETEIETIPANARVPTPAPVATLPAPKPAAPPMHPETGEVSPHAIPFEGNWVAWGGKLVAAMKSAASREDGDKWVFLNNERLLECQEKAVKVYDRIVANIDDMRGRFPEPELLGVEDAPTILSDG